MNKEIENIVSKLSQNITDRRKDENFGSIILIIMLVGISLSLIRVVQECNKKSNNKEITESIHKLCQNKNWFTKMKIKRIIRKEIGSDKYKIYGKDILDSILETGEKLTLEEAECLLREAGNV
jgi:hypothetical protein